MQQFGASVLN